MARGTIKTFNPRKGFGFIHCDDGTEIFFHQTAVMGSRDDLKEGRGVEFQRGQGPKGERAENVKLVS